MYKIIIEKRVDNAIMAAIIEDTCEMDEKAYICIDSENIKVNTDNIYLARKLFEYKHLFKI